MSDRTVEFVSWFIIAGTLISLGLGMFWPTEPILILFPLFAIFWWGWYQFIKGRP